MAVKAGEAILTIRGDIKALEKDFKKAKTLSEKSMSDIADVYTKGFKLVGGAVAGVGAAVLAIGIPFEKTMATVKGVTKATEKEFIALTAQARAMGAATEHSATQAAEGLKFLGMAGFTASESIQALPGVLDLATAGGLSLGLASDIVSDSLTAMGLEVKDLTRLNDVFVATITNSNTNIEQLGMAFSKVAPVAAGYGVELESLSAMLGVLANAGIKAELAGTQLKNALINNAKAAKSLGMEGADLITTLKAAKEAQWGVTEITEHYGKIALPGVLNLMNKMTSGKGSYEDLLQKTRDSAGATKDLATIMRDTLGGSVKTLISTLEDLALTLFDAFKGDSKNLVDDLTKALRENKDTIVALVKALVPAVKILGAGGLLVLGLKAGAAAIALAKTAMLSYTTAIKLNEIAVKKGAITTNVLNKSLWGTSVATKAASGAFGALTVAAGVVFAAFAGWKIGEYLYDQFEEARLAGLALVDSVMKGWIMVESGVKLVWAAISSAVAVSIAGIMAMFEGFISMAGKAADFLGADEIAASMKKVSAGFKGAKDELIDYTGIIEETVKATNDKLEAHDKTIESLRKEAIQYDKNAKSIKQAEQGTKLVAIAQENLIKSYTKSTDSFMGMADARTRSNLMIVGQQIEQEKAEKANAAAVIKHAEDATKAWEAHWDSQWQNIAKYQTSGEAMGATDMFMGLDAAEKRVPNTKLWEESWEAASKRVSDSIQSDWDSINIEIMPSVAQDTDFSAFQSDMAGITDEIEKFANESDFTLSTETWKGQGEAAADAFWDGVGDGFIKSSKNKIDWGTLGKDIAADFNTSLEQGISDSLVVAMTGDFDDISEVWEDLWDDMVASTIRGIANILAEMAAAEITKAGVGFVTSFFHSGATDIPFDSYPATLQKGESVLPKGLTSMLSGSDSYDDLGQGSKDYLASFFGWDNASKNPEMYSEFSTGATNPADEGFWGKTGEYSGYVAAAYQAYMAYKAFEEGNYLQGGMSTLSAVGTAADAYNATTAAAQAASGAEATGSVAAQGVSTGVGAAASGAAYGMLGYSMSTENATEEGQIGAAAGGAAIGYIIGGAGGPVGAYFGGIMIGGMASNLFSDLEDEYSWSEIAGWINQHRTLNNNGIGLIEKTPHDTEHYQIFDEMFKYMNTSSMGINSVVENLHPDDKGQFLASIADFERFNVPNEFRKRKAQSHIQNFGNYYHNELIDQALSAFQDIPQRNEYTDILNVLNNAKRDMFTIPGGGMSEALALETLGAGGVAGQKEAARVADAVASHQAGYGNINETGVPFDAGAISHLERRDINEMQRKYGGFTLDKDWAFGAGKDYFESHTKAGAEEWLNRDFPGISYKSWTKDVASAMNFWGVPGYMEGGMSTPSSSQIPGPTGGYMIEAHGNEYHMPAGQMSQGNAGQTAVLGKILSVLEDGREITATVSGLPGAVIHITDKSRSGGIARGINDGRTQSIQGQGN